MGSVGLKGSAVIVLAATLALAAPTLAQEGNRELQAAMQRLHELTAQAERAHEQGRHDRAQQFEKQAEQLEQRIHQHMREQDRAAEREHAERERGEREHAERERGEREHAERERGEREHAERERGEREHAEHAERGEREHAELGDVLEGLRRGIWALRQIGRNEEAQHLANIAEGVARRLELARRGDDRGDDREQRAEAERRETRRVFAVVRYAVEGLVEADRHDAADLLERALHARELESQGRRDGEAMQIRERAPGLEDVIELLSLAARELHRQGRGERADAVAELTEQLRRPRETDRRPESDRPRRTDRRRDTDRPRERDDRNDRGDRDDRDDRRPDRRQGLEHQIEIMQMAMPALLEAERKEAAETIKRAIQVRQVNLRGLEGKEAKVVRERAPSLGQTVEILGLAAKLWREFGNEDKAEAVANLAERMWAQRERRDDDRPRRERRRDRDDR